MADDVRRARLIRDMEELFVPIMTRRTCRAPTNGPLMHWSISRFGWAVWSRNSMI